MAKLMEVVQWIMAHGLEIVASVQALLMALIALFMLIPGEQPEKALRSIVELIARLSRKELPKD